jgi:hypothetical protein
MTYIIGLGTESDSKSLKLETRARRHVNNVMRPEGAPGTMRAAIEIIRGAYPAVMPVAASKIYNCYGLAFAARRTAVVDEDDVRAILTDDQYKILPWDPNAWLPGDIVIYRASTNEIAHVAVVARLTRSPSTGDIVVDVISAWGDSGEYLHPIDVASPLLGRPSEVVSQRFLL